MEPITTIIVTALAAGAAASAIPHPQIVKDAYAGLKELDQRKTCQGRCQRRYLGGRAGVERPSSLYREATCYGGS